MVAKGERKNYALKHVRYLFANFKRKVRQVSAVDVFGDDGLVKELAAVWKVHVANLAQMKRVTQSASALTRELAAAIVTYVVEPAYGKGKEEEVDAESDDLGVVERWEQVEQCVLASLSSLLMPMSVLIVIQTVEVHSLVLCCIFAVRCHGSPCCVYVLSRRAPPCTQDDSFHCRSPYLFS